jgi:uncharacterized protein
MRFKLLDDTGQKTFAVILDTGDEAMASLLAFAKQHHITAAHFTAIGAFSAAVLGYFDWEKKDYSRIPVGEQVEVVSLIGDVALEKDQPKVHAHAVIGKRGGTAMAGHLLEGHVRPTLEITLIESPEYLRREFDPRAGIALIKI